MRWSKHSRRKVPIRIYNVHVNLLDQSLSSSPSSAPQQFGGQQHFSSCRSWHEPLRQSSQLCLSKISKCLSGWGLFLFHNSCRCSFLSRHRRTSLQNWRTIVRNHTQSIVACDFLVVVTARFRTLYVFLLMEAGTRRIVHCDVTTHPTAAWTLQQLREAIPSDHSYQFLIHDRDSIFSAEVDPAGQTPIGDPLALRSK
jgi:hypothetical protein